MFWKKKDASFFKHFRDHAESVSKGADYLNKIFTKPVDLDFLVQAIKREEHIADDICHSIIKEISLSGFILPIDREDIFNFSKATDEIINAINHTAESYAIIYKLNEMTLYANQLCSLILELGKFVQLSAKGIETPSENAEETLKYCRNLYRIEHDADTIARDALQNLFIKLKHDQISLADYLAWSDIYRRLEIVTDRGVDFANVVEQIILKYS
ncbi:DUF47 domain-containing protein [Criblamydia sequanensis]|uniref:Phosphate transport regulator n=1 Tax=Candidatus Criblamydia sequanensis CRIB-18 TaxID=1437425 RepID=A0A090CYR1_9BACT|nr:DUF47 family protein [Criblamydia sequanensis]CDR33797.1 Putative phosphate transport regulator [Criblamydia sequanensis CRIB-18]